MFGDQPEAADLGRNCKICRVELEVDRLWCQRCTTGEASLWERLEKLEISSGERTVMSILTGWSQQLPGWNLQQGLEMLLKPSNRRLPRSTQPKRAPFVVVEGIDSSGKTIHVEAIANALAHLRYSVKVITFPNSLTPLGRFLKHVLQQGSHMECWTQHILFSLHRWEMVDYIQESLITGTAVICERYAWSGVVYSYVSNPRMPVEAYMTCDHGILQPDVVVLLTTSPQESIGKKNAISPQFEDESIQQKLWDTYHCECSWKGVNKLDFHPLLRPHESRKVLQRKLTEFLRAQPSIDQWQYLWETPQMVIRPTEMVKCLIHLWRYIKGTSSLSMTSFFPNPSSVFGKLRLNVYVDASFSSGGSRSRSGMAMYLVDTTDGSESIIQWASRRQTSMAASAPEAEVTAMAEGFATAIFLFDSLKEIQVITGFGPDCILSMKTDSAVALKQMNTHTATVRTRTAAQKLAFLRELIYQDPQIQPIYIPGPSQRADSQTKCLSGPALRKAQDYLNLRHVVTPVVNTIRVLGMDWSDADSSAGEKREGCERKRDRERGGSDHVQSEGPCPSQEQGLGRKQDQEGMQASTSRILCELDQENVPFLYRLRMDCNSQDQGNIFLQEYRRIVTSIRQEDIGVDVHDKRFPMPSMCGSSHMPRKEEGSAHKRTKPQTPTPKGDISSTDERVKADRETQRHTHSIRRIFYSRIFCCQEKSRQKGLCIHCRTRSNN